MTRPTTFHVTAAAITALLLVCPSGLNAAEPVRTEATVSLDDVDAIVGKLTKAKKPLPAWIIELVLKAYDAYKTYRNGERVEEIKAEVDAVLALALELQADIEAGREMSDREYRRTRDLIDLHSQRIGQLEQRMQDFDSRLRVNEAAVAAQAQRMLAWRNANRACKQPMHVWRPKRGGCVHIDVAR